MKASPSPTYSWRFFASLPISRGKPPFRARRRSTPTARIEAMASRFAFGASGSWLGADPCFRPVGTDGSQLEIGIPHRDLRRLGDRVGWCGCRENSPDGVERVPGTHNRLSFRCRSVVWLLTRRPGAVPGPVAGDLPEAGHDCREGRESGFRPEGGNRPSDEPFELPGAQDRAQGVLPPKTAFSARPVDPEWINPIGRGSDKGRQERRIRAEQRRKGRKQDEFDRCEMKREGCGEPQNPLKIKGDRARVSPRATPERRVAS